MERLKIKAEKWIKIIETNIQENKALELDTQKSEELKETLKGLKAQNIKLRNEIVKKDELFGLGE